MSNVPVWEVNSFKSFSAMRILLGEEAQVFSVVIQRETKRSQVAVYCGQCFSFA